MAYHSGYNGEIKIGDVGGSPVPTVLCAVRWSVNHRVDDLDTTNFCDGGFATRIRGVEEAEISFEANWDDTEDPHQSPLGIYPGDKRRIILTPDVINNPTVFFTFPSVLLTSVVMNTEVRGVVNYSVTGMSDGSFTVPDV